MVIRMRHTKGKRNRVRSHHALVASSFSQCTHCSAAVRPHMLCKNCGWYRGRQVIDVLAKLDKKQRKQKEKELEHSK